MVCTRQRYISNNDNFSRWIFSISSWHVYTNKYCRRQLSSQSSQRLQLIFARIAVYVISCLPFSLKAVIPMGPTMITILHSLCILQFSLNFIIYTIMPSNVRDMHTELYQKIKTTCLFSCKNFHQRIAANSVSSVNQQFSDTTTVSSHSFSNMCIDNTIDESYSWPKFNY